MQKSKFLLVSLILFCFCCSTGSLFLGCVEVEDPKETSGTTNSDGSGSSAGNQASNTTAQTPNDADCWYGFQNIHYCLKYSWVKTPHVGKNNEILLWVWQRNATSYSAPSSTLEFDPQMLAHGHGTDAVTIETISDGIYRIKDINFKMDGRWDIFIRFFKNGNKLDEAVLQLDVL